MENHVLVRVGFLDFYRFDETALNVSSFALSSEYIS